MQSHKEIENMLLNKQIPPIPLDGYQQWKKLNDAKTQIENFTYAKNKVQQTIYATDLFNQINNEGEMGEYQPIDQVIERTSKRKKPNNIWLTVNPRPDVSLADFQKVVNKYVNKKYIDQYIYCYEVRRKDEGKEGLHLHSLIKYNCRPYDIKRNTKNHFQKLVGNDLHIDIKYVEDNIALEKLEYMKGNKQQKKQSGVQATIAYREKYKLEKLYGMWPTPSLVRPRTQTEEVD